MRSWCGRWLAGLVRPVRTHLERCRSAASVGRDLTATVALLPVGTRASEPASRRGVFDVQDQTKHWDMELANLERPDLREICVVAVSRIGGHELSTTVRRQLTRPVGGRYLRTAS
jgi:hypothetical protein